MTLIEKMLKAGKLKSFVASKNQKVSEFIPTQLPILNVAFSGSLDGGIAPGLTVIAGPSKSFKSLLTLYCLKAFQDKHKDGICLFYDCEYGITDTYMEMYGIDTSRVVVIDIANVEEFKFDIVKKLEAIEENDKVFIMVDSLGVLASKKEVDDALSENTAADMTRARAIRGLLRIITPLFVRKGVTCIMIGHIYQEIGSNPKIPPKNIVSGGTAIMYSANQVFIMGKRQISKEEKDDGSEFVINIEKSRFVKEKSKLPFVVRYEDGIGKWSSLFEMAVEAGFITGSGAWFTVVDPESGEVEEKKRQRKKIEEDDEFFTKLIANESFKKYVEGRYKLGTPKPLASISLADDNEEEYEE